MSAPAIIIGGTSSGVGKTSIALGIVAALRKRGLTVQPFKVGPDFLDPLYMNLASGQTCYNLDGWMCGLEYADHLISTQSSKADLIVIEGVMGLFDSAGPTTLSGSTAEIAKAFDIPILLVGDAGGAARSFAATVHGFNTFEDGVQISGAVANRVGSEGHGRLLAECLTGSNQPPLIGAIPQGALPPLESRHLGLVSATRSNFTEEVCDQLATACETYLNLDQLLAISRTPRSKASATSHIATQTCAAQPKIRLAVARDDAFHFIYPDNLSALTQAGAELAFFSPLSDSALPDDIDGIYIPGGYPEVFAEGLSANEAMRSAIHDYAGSGRVVYAECGGLMYLSNQLETDNARWPMCGVLPITTRMLPKRKMLGYTEVTLSADSHFGSAGTQIRGHEFHYSEIIDDQLTAFGWQEIYSLERRRGSRILTEGFYRDKVLASYVHLHWGSSPDCARAFIDFCKTCKENYRD